MGREEGMVLVYIISGFPIKEIVASIGISSSCISPRPIMLCGIFGYSRILVNVVGMVVGLSGTYCI